MKGNSVVLCANEAVEVFIKEVEELKRVVCPRFESAGRPQLVCPLASRSGGWHQAQYFAPARLKSAYFGMVTIREE